MAIETEELTFNTAMDVAIDAWVAYVNTLDDGEEVQIVFSDPFKGALAADTTQGTAAGIKAGFQFGMKYHWNNDPNTADNVPQSIGNRGLFFKVTNAADELT